MPCRKHKNPPVSVELALAIRDGMARYLWVSAVADYTEEHRDDGDLPYPDDGENWEDVVSETPHAAQQAADDLIELFAANEKLPADEVMLHLFELAATIDIGTPIMLDPAERYDQQRAAELQHEFDELIASGKKDARTVRRREQILGAMDDMPTVADVAMSFGADMAAQALGSGVAWSDDHKVKRETAEFKPVIPSFECHFDGEDLTWSGRGEGPGIKSGHEATRSPRWVWTNIENVIGEDPDTEEEVEETIESGTGHEVMWPTDAERELGWTPVDKAVDFIHRRANNNEIETNFHGSPHTLTQGPERKLTWTILDAEPPIHGRSQQGLVLRLEGFMWAEQCEIFERIYREEWTPQPTQIGRITVVNPGEHAFVNRRRYVLWFDAHAPRYLMAYARSLDDALDECVDWLEDQGLEGYFVDQQVTEEFDRLRAAGESDDNAMDQAEVDTTSAGNHGRHLNSEDWGIAAEDPNDEQLRALGRGNQ